MAKVLVIDDDRGLGIALLGLLNQIGRHEARHVTDAASALEAVRSEPTDLALLDVRLGTESGLELLPKLKALRPEMSVIMITALASIDMVVEAMKLGADNFVVKPIDPPRLLALVGKGLEAHQLRRKSAQLDRVSHPHAPALQAESEEMGDVLQLADAVASRATTVLLLGETGTGKGMLARYIHGRSPRAAMPFVELNCAGLSRELVESELFGYERGAFTGAQGRKVGLFDAADNGTLFLDEIGELDATVQAKLLKALEERRFRRLGGVTEIAVDVRVVAATHRDLEAAAAQGTFRSDLLYRLNVFPITLPPLRARRDDVLALARRFLGEAQRPHAASAISPEAAAQLEAYTWPGNVRELRNVMERAAILAAPGQPIEPAHLPPLPTTVATPRAGEASSLGELERGFLARMLQEHGGNIKATAAALGVSRGTLYRKIAKYKLTATE
jgi:DNA-binding NtrC family response regulator